MTYHNTRACLWVAVPGRLPLFCARGVGGGAGVCVRAAGRSCIRWLALAQLAPMAATCLVPGPVQLLLVC